MLAFEAAIAAARQELHSGGEGLVGIVPEDVGSLFDVYAMLLGSDSLVVDTIERIRSGNWAPGAWRETISRHAAIFEQMEDPYLRTRADDIREIGEYVLAQLQSRETQFAEIPERCILFGETVWRCEGSLEVAAAGKDRILNTSWVLPLASVYETDVQMSVAMRQSAESALRHVALVSQLMPLAMLLIVVLAAWVLIHMIRQRMAPLTELEAATRSIQEGNYDTEVVIRTDDEFEQMKRHCEHQHDRASYFGPYQSDVADFKR